MYLFLIAVAVIFLTFGILAWIADHWPEPYDWTEVDHDEWIDYKL